MAHEIKKMVYAGDVPWHGLGVKLPGNASWEQIVADAGFYDVAERRLLYLNDHGMKPIGIPDKKALVRGDTNEYLATVSSSYHVVQFAQVAETLVKAAGEVKAVFHTAGTLGEQGIRGWMLAELPNPIKVKGDKSEVRKYLLGTAAHDGHHGVTIKNVATRVVCQNTLGVALRERSDFNVAIWHTKSAGDRMLAAVQGFKRIAEGYDRFADLANRLATTKFTDKQMMATVDQLMPLRDDKPSKAQQEKRDRVLSLFEVGTGIEGAIRGTAWAAFQAWTEYADHHRVTRETLKPEQKLESIWFGASATLKQASLESIATQAKLSVYA